MIDFYTLRRKLRPALVPAVGAFLVGYFLYHAVQGDHGVLARSHLRTELAQADETLSALRAERERLEHRVSLLGVEQLDPDMLEERARVMLNFAHPDDVVYFYPRWSAPMPGDGDTGPR
ncbi:MAG: septum formation initiator family protein [Inquilinus sp.]|nr:septum formation initiator family protein [Inquilinus sp.]